MQIAGSGDWEPSSSVAAGALPSRRVLAADSLVSLASNVFGAMSNLIFWVVAAFLYSAADVGSAGVVIGAALGLSTLSNFGMGTLATQYLPMSGSLAMRWFFRSHYAVFTASLVTGTAFVIVAPRSLLFGSPTEVAMFPVLVAILSISMLYDPAASGLGRARWGALANVSHAMMRLLLLPLFAVVPFGTIGVVLAWFLPVTILVPILSVAIMSRIGTTKLTEIAPRQIRRGQLLRDFRKSFAPALLAALVPALLPLIVMVTLGREQAGYYIVTFSLVMMLAVLMSATVGPFVTAAGDYATDLAGLTYRFGFVLVLATLASTMFLAIIAPTGLGIIGEDYRTYGGPLLALAAAAIPFLALQAFYGAFSQLRRDYRKVIASQFLSTATLLLGATIFAGQYGLVAVGWSFLLAEALVAAVVFVPTVRAIRAATRMREPGRAYRGAAGSTVAT
ncbi:lipopolysaccharide biosynthesis protein [Hoyosella subflava]|uniref:lipopolysaccharide biosynthesis protein n=1 Tax=Hoyosella subflava TaxID=639313 RepID=UPI0011D18716|nr:hypothetical protein [Hoyosella subflava]